MSNTPEAPSQVERRNAAIIHLASAFAAPFLAPLIGYLLFQPNNDFAYRQAREGLNFQISVIIYTIGLCMTIVGIFVVPLLLAASWILLIYAGIQTYSGVEFKFPLTLRLIKN